MERGIGPGRKEEGFGFEIVKAQGLGGQQRHVPADQVVVGRDEARQGQEPLEGGQLPGRVLLLDPLLEQDFKSLRASLGDAYSALGL